MIDPLGRDKRLLAREEKYPSEQSDPLLDGIGVDRRHRLDPAHESAEVFRPHRSILMGGHEKQWQPVGSHAAPDDRT